MYKITAKYIFDGINFLPLNSVLLLNENNILIDIQLNHSNTPLNYDDVKNFENAVLCPGFINAHCHLELSHLKNTIPKHTGLINFILSVIKKRYLVDETYLNDCIEKEIENLRKQGVVAVGDICNNTNTIKAKLKSDLYFHNFIETIGFDNHYHKEKFNTFIDVLNQFETHFKFANSLSPHAPYSVSKFMFEQMKGFIKNKIVSIHNQECEDENIFYKNKTGHFIDFYKSVNINIDFFEATQKTSLQSVFSHLTQAKKIILVHNIFISKADINNVAKAHQNIFYCICPNANLYIQNKLPDLNLLQKENVNIIIGTDSLASNEALNILSELKTIQNYFPHIALNNSLKWACYNGAVALNIDDKFGSFKIGTPTKVLCIDNIITKKEDINKIFLSLKSKSVLIN